VLKDGRAVEQGRCEKIFSRPSHEYTRRLIRASELLLG
ncbi:MAG: ABC transporter ATP-binding protein, partial [Euryarchaeota archaeon]|nr:ABC transporter ATP-binding protein [Euryarchaeota archaeon]